LPRGRPSPHYDQREQEFGDEIMRQLERAILLQIIDNRWREHLYDMTTCARASTSRGFAQIDLAGRLQERGLRDVRAIDLE